jgi:hypothetical protein
MNYELIALRLGINNFKIVINQFVIRNYYYFLL